MLKSKQWGCLKMTRTSQFEAALCSFWVFTEDCGIVCPPVTLRVPAPSEREPFGGENGLYASLHEGGGSSLVEKILNASLGLRQRLRYACGSTLLRMTALRIVCHPERSVSGVVAAGLAKR